MSDNLQNLYVQQYNSNLQLLLQQRGSRLREAVMSGTHIGAQAAPVDQISPITANKVTQRFAPITRTDAGMTRRWAFPVDYDSSQLVDSFDKLRIVNDPTGYLVQNAGYALGRAMDQEIINAFFGSSATGVNGGTPVSFTSGNIVNVDNGSTGASGMSVAKLRAVKKLFMANEVDLDFDPLYCAMTSKQHDDLLQEVQVIDADFNGGKPIMEEGKISRFLGINFIHIEFLGTGVDSLSGTSTLVPIWAKSGMYLGLWNDIETKISQRDDLTGLPWQAYAKASIGGARLDEKRVAQVQCR